MHANIASMHAFAYADVMAGGKTVQIRDVTPELLSRLVAMADERVLSLSAFLRLEFARIADLRTAQAAWLARRPEPIPGLTREFVVETIRESRGPLPEGDE